MKLKNVLILAFITLTFIPSLLVSLLLYKSGYDLSKEAYIRNLTESINVQSDYISQTIENNMIFDYRFVNRNHAVFSEGNTGVDLFKIFQIYLDTAEDKIAVSILLDQDKHSIYTIGEKLTIDNVLKQLPKLSSLKKQIILEFEIKEGFYSLGTITPVWIDGNYCGSLVSVYDQNYIFKIISSYYKISDTSTLICRQNGSIVNFKGTLDNEKMHLIEQATLEMAFDLEGTVDLEISNQPLSGYYKNIYNTPWYLVGFVDSQSISSFTNQFVLIYIFLIIIIFIIDIILAYYFSRRVVGPINALIKVMEGYQNTFNSSELHYDDKNGYYETRYLWKKFFEMMKKILLVQHNFEGIYQLYQSSDMGDINIDIDVMEQVVSSNKEVFDKLMAGLDLSEDDCVVERFIQCFCDKDQIMLRTMFENMRDQHLSVTCEAEIYTSYLNQRWFHILVVPMYTNERLSRLFVQLRDISGFKKQEYESIEQASRDALTGLYNRVGFTQHVNDVLQNSNKSDIHALLFIDMNYFKLVNDNLGHKVGDEVLMSVGHILQDAVGSTDIACRFGGDEFAVFLTKTSEEMVAKVVDDLNRRLVYPFHTEKFSFTVSASIGVSLSNRDTPISLEKLLHEADVSMYCAKREFKQKKTNEFA